MWMVKCPNLLLLTIMFSKGLLEDSIEMGS